MHGHKTGPILAGSVLSVPVVYLAIKAATAHKWALQALTAALSITVLFAILGGYGPELRMFWLPFLSILDLGSQFFRNRLYSERFIRLADGTRAILFTTVSLIAAIERHNDRCGHWTLQVSTIIATISAAILWIRAEMEVPKNIKTLAIIVESIALVLLIIGDPKRLAPHQEHLTWWGISLLLVYDIATLAGGDYQKSIGIVVACLSGTIAIGVIVMSFHECKLLNRALDENGSIVYIFGNFAMHYYPTMRVAWDRAILSEKTVHLDANRQIAVATCAVSLYVCINSPIYVYSCQMEEWIPILLLPVTTVVTGAAAKSWLRSSRPQLQ